MYQNIHLLYCTKAHEQIYSNYSSKRWSSAPLIFQGRKWNLHSPESLRLEEEFQGATKPFPSPSDLKKYHNDSNILLNPLGSNFPTLCSLRNGLEITRSDEVEKSMQSLKRTGAIQCVCKREAPEASCREEVSPAGNSDKRILPKNCDLIEEKWQGRTEQEEKAFLFE